MALLYLLYFLFFKFELNVVFAFFEGDSFFSLGVAKSIHNKPVESRIKYHRVNSWFLTLLLNNASPFFIFLWSIWVQLNISILYRNKLIPVLDLAGCDQFNMTEGHLLGSDLYGCRHMMFGTGLMQLKQINHLSLLTKVLVSLNLHHIDIQRNVVKHSNTSGIGFLRNYLKLLLLLSATTLLRHTGHWSPIRNYLWEFC